MFVIFKDTCNTCNPETGKWDWNPFDKGSTFVAGIKTDTEFKEVTGYVAGGSGYYIPAFSYSSQNGPGIGYYSPQDSSFTYLGTNHNRASEVVLREMNEVRQSHGAAWHTSETGDDYLVNPTGLGIRSDEGGAGHWDAPRGHRLHKGIDFSTIDGQNIFSPVNGKVRNFYGQTTGYPMIQIYPSNLNIGFDYIEILYAGAPKGIQLWSFRNITAGDVIGKSISLQSLGYPNNVGPHIHLQIWRDGVRIDPTPFFFKP